jgi:hypothetical protein
MASKAIGTEAIIQSALADAKASLPQGASSDVVYKIFMDRLGDGFTQAVGTALADAIAKLQDLRTSVPEVADLIDGLSRGPHVSMVFPTPGLTASTQKTAIKPGVPSTEAGVRALGVEISVGGSWSF